MIHTVQGFAGSEPARGQERRVAFQRKQNMKGAVMEEALRQTGECREGRCQIKGRGRKGFEHAEKVSCLFLVKELCLYPLSPYMPFKVL